VELENPFNGQPQSQRSSSRGPLQSPSPTNARRGNKPRRDSDESSPEDEDQQAGTPHSATCPCCSWSCLLPAVHHHSNRRQQQQDPVSAVISIAIEPFDDLLA